MNLDEVKAEYKRIRAQLCYDGASHSDFDAAFKRILKARKQRKPNEHLAPEQLVALVKKVQLPCRHCLGTGRYVTHMQDGQPVGPGMLCFRCNGKGKQNFADSRRNVCYDRKRGK